MRLMFPCVFRNDHLGRREPREQLPVPYVPPFKAYVGNLIPNLKESDIRGLFAPAELKDVSLKQGFCVVTFDKKELLEAALLLNGKEFRGRKLVVDVAPAKAEKKGARKEEEKPFLKPINNPTAIAKKPVETAVKKPVEAPATLLEPRKAEDVDDGVVDDQFDPMAYFNKISKGGNSSNALKSSLAKSGETVERDNSNAAPPLENRISKSGGNNNNEPLKTKDGGGRKPNKRNAALSIFIGNFPQKASENELRALFGNLKVAGVRVMGKKAFVEFQDAASLEEGLKKDGAVLQGQKLKIQKDRVSCFELLLVCGVEKIGKGKAPEKSTASDLEDPAILSASLSSLPLDDPAIISSSALVDPAIISASSLDPAIISATRVDASGVRVDPAVFAGQAQTQSVMIPTQVTLDAVAELANPINNSSSSSKSSKLAKSVDKTKEKKKCRYFQESGFCRKAQTCPFLHEK